MAARRARMDDASVRKMLRDLQRQLPTIYPVRFERCPDLTDWGECALVTRRRRRYLVIRIAEWLPWPADYLVVIHEYSHAINWKPERMEAMEKEDHSAEWGVKYARVWRKTR